MLFKIYNNIFVKVESVVEMKSIFLLSSFILFANATYAAPIFSGDNFSGVYHCKGNNTKVGGYEVMATLKLNRHSSQDNFGAYDITTETENAFVYKGQAIAQGHKLALTLNFSDSGATPFTTGIANISEISPGRWAYQNYYYEPDGTVGVFGTERCVMQAPNKPNNKQIIQQPTQADEPAIVRPSPAHEEKNN